MRGLVWCALVATLFGDGRSNHIVEENALPGSPSSEWDVNGAGDPSIQGFAHQISVNRGEHIKFKVDTDSADYRIDVYRVGYYGGAGARLVATVRPDWVGAQPPCRREARTKLVDCGNWRTSAAWAVPANATSGVYLARLVRQDDRPPATWRADNSQYAADPRFARPGAAGLRKPEPEPHSYGALGHGRLRNALREPRASLIYFVVRDDSSTAAIVFQTSDTTWQAYNRYGGANLYMDDNAADPRRAYVGSYNRPFNTRDQRPINILFGAEYPMIRWLERNGYDVTYITGVDTDRAPPDHLLRHRLFLSVGHDEYWSANQRANVVAARDAGVHLAFFSGNELFWKIRWEPSPVAAEDDAAVAGDAHRVLVCYKETQEIAKLDPDPAVWTGTWRDARPINPEGAQPENAVTGTIFTVNAWRNDPLQVPYLYSGLRFWRNTSVATLQPGERRVLLKGLLGHEWDEDVDNGFRPAGLIRLSRTRVDNVLYIQDQGSTYDSGSATHHLTLYRAASGALVFGAGTVQWSWGLDAHHDCETGIPAERANLLNIRVGEDLSGPDRDVQQATVNLFADMGVQPAALQEDLHAAEPSQDGEPPRCWFVDAEGVPMGKNAAPALAGFIAAIDGGGGVVAGVEVSADGRRWHPAEPAGEGSNQQPLWAYALDGPPAGGRLYARAVDDSCNLQRVPTQLRWPSVPAAPGTAGGAAAGGDEL